MTFILLSSCPLHDTLVNVFGKQIKRLIVEVSGCGLPHLLYYYLS